MSRSRVAESATGEAEPATGEAEPARAKAASTSRPSVGAREDISARDYISTRRQRRWFGRA
eukprot:6891543-Prymnesium_polylepis.1